MKIVKIEGNFYNTAQIVKIAPRKAGNYVVHFADGKTIKLAPEALQELFNFLGAETFDPETLTIGSAVSGF